MVFKVFNDNVEVPHPLKLTWKLVHFQPETEINISKM